MAGRLARVKRWVLARSVIGIAVVLLTFSILILFAVESDSGTRSLGSIIAVFVGLGALLVGLQSLLGSTSSDDEHVAPAPWTSVGGIVDHAPERTSDEHPLSGDALASDIERAGTIARRRGTVEAGFEDLRPTLRVALLDALVRGGMDRPEAETAVEEGTWTDDRAAAASLSADVTRPDWQLRERVRAWLFPERMVRREARRAVHEMGRTASEHVPVVPGRSAPRTVPVVRPGLGELRRGADGELQEASEPLADPTATRGRREDSADGSTADRVSADKATADQSATDQASSDDGHPTEGEA